MLKRLPLLFVCFLLLGFSHALAQDTITLRRVTMINDDKSSLTSDKKDKLSMSVSGRSFVGAVFLPAQTPVKVVSRNSFTVRESVGTLAKQVNRTFNVGMIEVLDGDHRGIKGWAVLDVQDEGRSKDVYIGPGRAVSSADRSQASAATDNSVDLVVSVGAGHISPTGGRLYEVGVVNKGGVVHKGSVEITVSMDGRVVKTERLRGPIQPNQALSFTLPVSDSELRKRVKITATISPNSAPQDANPGNNTTTVTAAP